MSPRQIYSSSALSTLYEETFYTTVRIEADPASADLAPLLAEECARVRAAIAQEGTLTEAELRAQAIVDCCQEAVQADIDRMALDLMRLVRGDRSDPTYLRLFRTSPSLIAKAGLDTQMAAVRDWPAFLAAEPDLAAWSGVFASHLVEGGSAIGQRDRAATVRRDWRAREREEVFTVANAFRGELRSMLGLRIREKGKARTWPDGFFRRGRTASSNQVETPTAPTICEQSLP